MKIILFTLLLLTLLVSACEKSEDVGVQQSIRVEFSESPIWVIHNCEEKTINFRIDNLKKEAIQVKVDNEIVDVKFNETNGTNSNYGELILPANKRYESLYVLNKKEDVVIASERIIYKQKGDTIDYYSRNYELPKPILIGNSKCWVDYNGNRISENQEYHLNYQLERVTENIGKKVKRTLQLRNVHLEYKDPQQKRHSIAPDLIHSVTSNNYGKLENENIHLDSNGKMVANITKDNINVSFPIQYSTIIRGNGDPSYRIIEYVYGNKIKGVINLCNEIDTIDSKAFILPEFIQVELNCEQN